MEGMMAPPLIVVRVQVPHHLHQEVAHPVEIIPQAVFVPTVPLPQEVVVLVALRMVLMVPLHQEAVALVALQVVLTVHPLGNHLGSHSGPNLPVPDSVMLTQKYPQQTLVTYIL